MKSPDDTAGGAAEAAGELAGEPDVTGIFGEIFDASDDAGDDDAGEVVTPAGKPKSKPVGEVDSDDEAVDPDGADLAPEAETAEEEEDPEPEDDEDQKLKLPEKFRARIDKVVKQREAARAERDAAKAEAAALKERVAAAEAEPVMLTPTASSPLANVRNAEELQAAAQYWENLLDWAEDNDNGGTLVGPDGKEQELDRAAVKRLRRTARDMVEKAVPERRAFLERRPEAVKKAKTAYPFLADPNHKGAKYAAQLVGETGLASRHDYELVAADAYIGALVRTGAANVVRDSKTGEVKIVPRGTTPPASKKAAPESPPVKSRASAQPLREAGREGRRQEVLATGNAEEIAAMAFADVL